MARLYVSKLKSEVKSLHGHNQTLEAGMSENTSQLESLREQISKVRGVFLTTRLSKIWSIVSQWSPHFHARNKKRQLS